MNCAYSLFQDLASCEASAGTPAIFPWYAIRTKSNQERLASSILVSKGYAPYLPAYSERSRWSDRTVITERPLFPGYFFCRFEPKKHMPILTTPGVVSVLGFGSEPAPIPDTEIEAIRVALRSGLGTQPCSFLREGRRIRITRGSLEGLEGILLRQKGEWRLVVSVNMLQRSISVEIDRDWIASL
jgi:transcription elongation factor/antiterminator RfaH